MTIWSILLNRIDNTLGKPPWKEWRAKVINVSDGTPSAGAIPMLGPEGQLDPSMLPSDTNIDLQTDGVSNPVQDVLNLIEGTNIVLTSDRAGGVTIAATGSIATGFQNIDNGTNTTATMVIGSGATLKASGSGIVNATEVNGVPIVGALTHAGQIPISQPGNTEAIWADPLVQGLQAVGTSASTINPVLISGVDGSGNLKNLTLDSTGALHSHPAAAPATYLTTAINFSSSGANTIIAGGVGQTIRIYKIQFTVANSTTITFQDTSSVLFSGAYILIGNGASYGDFANGEPLFTTSLSAGFVINSSAAVSTQGQVWYTQQ